MSTTEQGVQFAERDGRRSSQRAGTAILADAIRAIDEPLARRIETSGEWRKKYMVPFGEVVAAGARSGKDALRIASDGLESTRRNIVFVRDGEESSLREAMSAGESPYRTEVVRGSGERVRALTVPYRGASLTGVALLDQIRVWADRGVLEPSCAANLEQVATNEDWLDLSDRTFALLGAASEMGPLAPLSEWGANVIAVDLPRPELWRHIVSIAKAGSGTLHVPVKADGGAIEDRAGADLMVDAPKVRSWLGGFDQPYTIGNYVYADGANFLRLAAAVDALIEDLLAERKDLSVAYLATPTDVFAVREEIVHGARRRAGGPLRSTLGTLSMNRLYARNYPDLVEDDAGARWGVSNALVPIQGPNYALAKVLQRWRGIVAREEGAVSSATVAPASRTKSVVKNKMLAAAYRGAPAFGLEIFEPETARVLTAALLVHDLRAASSAANPETPLAHPYDLFVEGALHGGMWRMPYQPRSVLPLALLRGMVKRS